MLEKNSEDQKILIGQRLKLARTIAGISRKDLESRFKISIHTFQAWELGRNLLTEKAASKLVQLFHDAGVSCTVQWLLEGEGTKPTLIESDLTTYPLAKDAAPLLPEDNAIQNEINFFKTNNPNAVVMMVTDDAMEPNYCKNDLVGGIRYVDTINIDKFAGHDCVVEIIEGTFFRRLIKRKTGYALVSLNAHTELEEPVIFSNKILAASPVVWHRWKMPNLQGLSTISF